MKKSDIKKMPQYYDGYIRLLEDMKLSEAMDKYGKNLFEKDKEKLSKIGDKVYAPGKWTVKDILQHLIDTERIFNYRALAIARKDKTNLPGIEEDDYAIETTAAKRSLDDLLSEFENLRKSTMDLFNSFDENLLMRNGICNGVDISVLAIGFSIPGHTLHHSKVIEERYFPLVKVE